MVSSAAFETSVFINCPFDDDYALLLRATPRERRKPVA